jgi:hypothetical protein
MQRLVVLVALAACGDDSAPVMPDARPPMFAQTAYIKSSTPLHDTHFRASALSGDGRTLVGSYEGVVTVYERDSNWRMTADVTPTTPSPGFGWSVAISRDGLTMAVGARDDQPFGNGTVGAVYVFRKSGSTWVQQTRIEGEGPYEEVAGKLALSADGNLVVALSRDTTSDAFRLRTYERVADTWSELPSTNPAAFSGPLALAPDGSTLAAATGTNVDVFARSGNDWVKRASLPTAPQAVHFETSLACSERCDTIALGDMAPPPPTSTAGFGAAAAYVFNGDGTAWTSIATLHADNSADGDQFGRSIAISDDGLTVVVGAPATADYAGTAYVYRHSNNEWPQVLSLTGSNTERLDIFGSLVAVSADATTMVVSAIYENSSAVGVEGDQTDNSQPYAGAAYVFEGTY